MRRLLGWDLGKDDGRRTVGYFRATSCNEGLLGSNVKLFDSKEHPSLCAATLAPGGLAPDDCGRRVSCEVRGSK